MDQSLWNFAESIALPFPCFVLNINMIGPIKWMLWRNKFSEDLSFKMSSIGILYTATSHRKSVQFDGILPKGPYPACLRMADRALLAGYRQDMVSSCLWQTMLCCILDFSWFKHSRVVEISLLHKLCGIVSLHWRHNGHDSISNHQPHDCLLNRLFRRRSKKISKLHVTGLCAGNPPETSEFPTQIASNAENVSIWWHHHVKW